MTGGSSTEVSKWTRARQSRIGVASVVAFTLFTDMLVYGAVIPCLPIIVIDRLNGDSTMVGFLFGCYAFGLLLATPVFAILSDRYKNRRYPMLGGMLGLVISTLAFAFATTYPFLVLARVAQGVAGGASWTIGLGLLADVFPTNKLGVVMGTVLTAHTVGFAIGPSVGVLYEFYGVEAPFIFCAAFAVLNFFAILWLAEPDHSKNVNQTPADVDERTPLVENTSSKDTKPITMIDLLKNWRILSCVLCVTVSASVFAGIEPALPIHLRVNYNASVSTIGFIFIAMVVPAFLAPAIGHLSDRVGRQAISAAGMIMMAIASPLVALHYSSIFWIIPPLMMFGLSSPVTLTPVLPEMGEAVHEMGGAAYAQVYALYNMAYSVGMFIGPVIAGLIMSAADFKSLMLVFGASLLVCTPIMMDWVALYKKVLAYIRR